MDLEKLKEIALPLLQLQEQNCIITQIFEHKEWFIVMGECLDSNVKTIGNPPAIKINKNTKEAQIFLILDNEDSTLLDNSEHIYSIFNK